MLTIARFGQFVAAIILLSFAFVGQSAVASARSPNIDFKLLYLAARMSNIVYDGKSEILTELKGRSASVATPGTAQVQYFIGFNDRKKLQGISVRGTDNDKNWDLDKDVKVVRDKKTGILMHRGFRTAAQAIYRDVRSRLKPGYTTYVTGHSLGGAVAAILGIYLHQDGAKVAGIITFGQPKFTDVAGSIAYQNLPFLRVIHQNDTVALLPDNDDRKKTVYAHIGPAINLLKGPYYVYATAEQTRNFSRGSFSKFLSQISLPDHKMKWYLYNLRVKQSGTRRVSFKDRERYIIRHKYGSGTDTVPAKPKYNFNHHN